MGSEWMEVRLSDVYEFRSGLSKPRSEFGFGHGFLTFKDVLDNFFVPDTLTALVNSTEKERSSCSVMKGDVFLTRTSETQQDLGMSCVALKDYESVTFNGFTKRLRPKPSTNVVPEYAAYYFRSPVFRRAMTSMSSLSTRASLNNDMLERLPFVLPPVEEQSAIGKILKSLDDKIELNRRMNETLESMASAIFKSWFINFDPVVYNAVQRGNSVPERFAATAARYQSTDHKSILPLDIANLFPDSFQDSELGPTPKGWDAETLGKHIEAVKGLSYKGKFLSIDGMPLHNLNSVFEGGGYKNDGLKRYSGEFKERHLVKPGDVIVANTEQGFGYLLIGYPAIVPSRYGEKGIFTHHVFRLRPHATSAMSSQYIYFLLRSRRLHEVVAGYTNGTTVNMLPKDGLEKPKVVLPSSELVNLFDQFITPHLRKSEKSYDENKILTSIRDTLLPKLISGELRVPDAEKLLEEIA